MPDHPSHFAGGGEINPDKADPDYLYFLQHLRPDGISYAFEIPADGASPPVSLKYEKRPIARSGPSRGRPRRKRRMEEEDSSAEPPWYESHTDFDKDYRQFMRHMRLENDRMVLEMGGVAVYYERDAARTGGGSKAEGKVKKDGKEVDGGAAPGEGDAGDEEVDQVATVIISDGPVINVSESDVHDWQAPAQKVEEDQEEWDEVKEVVVTASGEDGAVKVEVVNLDGPLVVVSEPDVCDMREDPASGQKIKVLEEEMDEVKEVVVAASGKDSALKGEGVGLDGPIVLVSEPDVYGMHEDPATGQKIKVLEEEEQLLHAPAMETLNIVNRETDSSNGHDEPHIASELWGVIWPAHIIKRPESDFKQRLIDVLGKPFSQGEYDDLVGMATIRRPAMKERRTRSSVKYYDSTHETSQSYFDRYPDLAKQVEGTSYSNRLALLRGFFFWLENIGHEDQFRPWRDDHTHYKLIPAME